MHITTLIPHDNKDYWSKGGSFLTVAPDDLEMYSKKKDFTKILTNHLKNKKLTFFKKKKQLKWNM